MCHIIFAYLFGYFFTVGLSRQRKLFVDLFRLTGFLHIRHSNTDEPFFSLQALV